MYDKCLVPDLENIAEVNFSKAKTFGSVIHKSVLEYSDFKAHEEYYMNLLSTADKRRFYPCRKSFMDNSIVKKIIDKWMYFEKVFTAKMPVEYEDKKVDLFCKVRADLITKNGWLIDVKTISNLSLVRKQVNSYRYDIQAAFYLDVLELAKVDVNKGIIFVFVETNPPYQCVSFYANGDLLDRGRDGNEYYRGYRDLMREMHFNRKKSRYEQLQSLPY